MTQSHVRSPLYTIMRSDLGTERNSGSSELRNPPHIQIEVMGELQEAMVDTGCTTTVVSEKYFQEILQHHKVNYLPVSGVFCTVAIGKKKERIRNQVMLKLKIGNFVDEIIALVVPRLISNIIIGSDVMIYWQSKIDFEKKIFCVMGNVNQETIPLVEEDYEIRNVRSVEEEEIYKERFFVENIVVEEIKEEGSEEMRIIVENIIKGEDLEILRVNVMNVEKTKEYQSQKNICDNENCTDCQQETEKLSH